MAVGSKLANRCASLLAYILLHVEVPAVVRLAAKCAKVFFKLVDLQKISLFQANATDLSSKMVLEATMTGTIQAESKVVDM